MTFIHPKDWSQWQAKNAQSHNCDAEFSVQTLHNAIIFAGINGSGIWANNTHFCNAWWLYRHNMPQTQTPIAQAKINQSVVYIGHNHGIWGHDITDHLRFFSFLFHPEYQHLKNYPLAYSVFNENDNLDENYLFLLKQLGIENQQLLKISKPTEFKTIFIPQECFFYHPQKQCHYFTKDYLKIINQIMEKIPENNLKQKIYFSRTQLNNKRDINEIAVENIFKNQGFKIIYPEKTPILTQLTLLKNASCFAATEGSIAHNVVFCSANTSILILRKARNFISHQITLNQIKPFHVHYIDIGFSPFLKKSSEWIAGPFFLYDSNYLRRYFNLPNKHFPLFLFLKTYALKEGFYFIFNSPFVLKLRAIFKIRSRLKKLFQK